LNRSDVTLGTIGFVLSIAAFLFLPQLFIDCNSAISGIDRLIPYDLSENCSMIDAVETTTNVFGLNSIKLIQIGTIISVLISMGVLIYGLVVTVEPTLTKNEIYQLKSELNRSSNFKIDTKKSNLRTVN